MGGWTCAMVRAIRATPHSRPVASSGPDGSVPPRTMTVPTAHPQTARRIRPAWTLRDVLGAGVAYLPRRSPNLLGWSPSLPGQLDFQGGLAVGIAGGAPYAASSGTATPAILAVLADGGLPCDADLRLYRSTGDYLDLLRRLRAEGLRLSTQRVHPVSEAPSAECTVPTDLQEALNDKGRMSEWVPEGWLPPRRVLATAELPAAADLLRGGAPVVLKAATPRPSGGGHCVWICRTTADVEQARAALVSEQRVVVETFLPLARTVCVHANVFPDGRTEVAGTAEEVVDASGRYRGNWIDAAGGDVPAAVLAVVRDIAAAGAARGYRGIAGVDVAFPVDGPPRVLDLNFRINGSTAAVWLRASIENVRGARTIRSKAWSGPPDFAALERAVRRAIDRGTLVPLGLYDPSACGTGGIPRVGGLLLGNSREEVEAEDRRLAADGLV